MYDTLELGMPLTDVKGQAVGLATNSTADFASTSCDGIFVRPFPSCKLRLPGAALPAT